jgi:DNA-binding transcriptional MerR regulator
MRIGDVSKQHNISSDTLRYYERIGLLPPVTRSESGIREFEEVDIKRIEFIKCMRNAGLPIEILIEYFHLIEQGDQTIEARKKMLIDQRAKLAAKMEELQETMDLLDYKIDVYEKTLLNAEKKIFQIEE